jgi:hypothetical protein
MPFPLLLLAPLAGALCAKVASAIRSEMNEGETVRVRCRSCGDDGPHAFSHIDRSWAGGAVIGVATGGVGGAISGMVADRVFHCRSCGVSMLESGEQPGWNADEAVDAAVNYQGAREAFEQLQSLVARNQRIASRHASEIDRLRRELEDERSDKTRLASAICSLIGRIEAEAA